MTLKADEACLRFSLSHAWRFLHIVGGTLLLVTERCMVSQHFNMSTKCLMLIIISTELSGLDIKVIYPMARGASRFEKLLACPKSYWPKYCNKICCYQCACHQDSRRRNVMQTLPKLLLCIYVFTKCKIANCENEKRKTKLNEGI